MSVPWFEGQRVKHAYADLRGKVDRVSGEYVRVRWDHPGLAFAALGTTADLVRPSLLEADGDANSHSGASE